MFPEAHETTIDGIPAFWTEIDESPRVTVTFGVGTRHDPPHLSGITNLVAQLLLDQMGPVGHSHQIWVGASITEFTLVGPSTELPGLVAELTGHIRSLATLDERELLEARCFINPDDPLGLAMLGATLLSHRFGVHGIGKSTLGPAALATLALGDVVAWAAQHLTRSNCVMTFVGPPPAATTLDLPEGVRTRHAPEVDLVQSPSLIVNERHPLSFSIVSPPVVGSFLAGVLEWEILRDMQRHHRLVRDIEFEIIDVDPARTSIDAHLDLGTSDVTTATTHLIALLQRLQVDGVAVESVDHALRDWDAAAVDRTVVGRAQLIALAYGHLLGRAPQTPRASQDVADALTRETVNDLLRETMPSLLVAVDDSAAPQTIVEDSVGVTLAHSAFWHAHGGPARVGVGQRWTARRRRRAPARHLRVTGDRLLIDVRDSMLQAELSDIVLVTVIDSRLVVLLDRHGRQEVIDVTAFRGGHTIPAALSEALPLGIVRHVTPR